MDITRGSLEDISRPASSDRTRIGSRVSTASLGEGGRIIRASPTSLEVLSSYTIEEQVHTMVFEAKSFAENISDEDAPGDLLPSETSQTDGSDEENDDPELQKAIKKMKRLDKILAQKVSKEKEVKKKGRELSQKLWRELQELPTKGGRKDVIENTKLFLALTSSTSNESNVELDVVPVFRTQIPEKEYPSQKCVEGECKKSDSATEPSEVDEEQDKEGKADSSRQTGDATGKQAQNFVTKNIELASSGHHVPMTLDEKQRLCELLQDIDNESEDHCSTVADHEGTASMCTMSIRLGEGYTPEPSELDQLVQIDSRLHTLLPREDFLSVRSPYPDHNLPQVMEVGLSLAAEETPLGERALRAMRETREQEARLRDIQQQLDAMERSQTESMELPRLAEEQLHSLLLECELALSRTQSLGTHRPSSRGSSGAASEVVGDWLPSLPCTPRLSSAALSELLREFGVTSASDTPVDTTMLTEEEEGR
ncbi:fibrous sheath-interacting protein 1 isoform X1 [Alosa alosa]|uniref:fibrous sheath-interacting protein 1 isoform X1 n=1 Tax=Alosa alosa TaxID=278164 RepID=UPI0020154FE4|nr:fibrous sheath-interacting protein 1 isoform X1 [Alosa alosa]XP_048083215.1 fibrous sheath-interacting protein 1 isoform X1 [Alosa alosa]